MFTRALKLISLSCLILASISQPASAGGSAEGWVNNDKIGSNVDANEGNSGSPGTRSGKSAGQPVCTYHLLTGDDATSAENWSQGEFGPAKGAEPGAWYRQICVYPDGGSDGIIMWRTTPADPATVAQHAFDSANLPVPSLSMNPAATQLQLVGLPIWLSIDGAQWKPVQASATEAGITATAIATPMQVSWNMGNGDVATCNGPGATYNANLPSEQQHSDCTYTYSQSSNGEPGGAYALTATVTWHVTWSATGVPAGVPANGDLGNVQRSTSAALRVGEVQALNGKG